MPLRFTLSAQIPSGKNQQEIFWATNPRTGKKRKVIKGNKRFTDWRMLAASELLRQLRRSLPEERALFPLKGKVRCLAWYCEKEPVPARGTRDLPGMQDALYHLMETVGLVKNDGQIKEQHWWENLDQPSCVVLEVSEL